MWSPTLLSYEVLVSQRGCKLLRCTYFGKLPDWKSMTHGATMVVQCCPAEKKSIKKNKKIKKSIKNSCETKQLPLFTRKSDDATRVRPGRRKTLKKH